jgi:hypothetical protein
VVANCWLWKALEYLSRWSDHFFGF